MDSHGQAVSGVVWQNEMVESSMQLAAPWPSKTDDMVALSRGRAGNVVSGGMGEGGGGDGGGVGGGEGGGGEGGGGLGGGGEGGGGEHESELHT